MKIMITGIEGFAGRHLATHFMTCGHELCGTVLRPSDLEEMEHRFPGLPLFQADLRFAGGMVGPISAWRPDAIVHLAAQSSGALAARDPVTTYRVNVLGTVNLFETACRLGWSGRILLASTADVYGRITPPRPAREEDPYAPIGHYAASKVMAELAAVEYSRNHRVRSIRVRSFPHTGPGQSDAFALSSFAKQIAAAERSGSGRIRVGNLDVVRDYTDVRDVVRAYGDLLEHGKDGEVYNVAGGTGRSLGSLLELMASQARIPVEIVPDPRRVRPVDIDYQVGDAAKIREEAGWEPQHDLDETLGGLLDFWRGRPA
jgi:GDP-4-dehydro-6-deoxy-D-mannose reductase